MVIRRCFQTITEWTEQPTRHGCLLMVTVKLIKSASFSRFLPNAKELDSEISEGWSEKYDNSYSTKIPITLTKMKNIGAGSFKIEEQCVKTNLWIFSFKRLCQLRKNTLMANLNGIKLALLWQWGKWRTKRSHWSAWVQTNTMYRERNFAYHRLLDLKLTRLHSKIKM